MGLFRTADEMKIIALGDPDMAVVVVQAHAEQKAV
jgi:hypothetical protein